MKEETNELKGWNELVDPVWKMHPQLTCSTTRPPTKSPCFREAVFTIHRFEFAVSYINTPFCPASECSRRDIQRTNKHDANHAKAQIAESHQSEFQMQNPTTKGKVKAAVYVAAKKMKNTETTGSNIILRQRSDHSARGDGAGTFTVGGSYVRTDLSGRYFAQSIFCSIPG